MGPPARGLWGLVGHTESSSCASHLRTRVWLPSGQGRLSRSQQRRYLQPPSAPGTARSPPPTTPVGQVLSHTTEESHDVIVLGGGEAQILARVPSASCPQSWEHPPAGSSEQNVRFLGEGRRLAKPPAGSGAGPHGQGGHQGEATCSWLCGTLCDQEPVLTQAPGSSAV